MFELAGKLHDPIDLSLGMPDMELPADIKEQAIFQLNDKPGYSVTAGYFDVRKAVAEKLKRKNQIDATPEEIIITSGATGGLSLALFSILNREDEVVVIDPYFVLYNQMIDFIGAKAVKVSSYPDFCLPIDRIKTAITSRTKVILINTPNNPTGAVYHLTELKALAELAKIHNIIIVSDEVYEPFVYHNNKHVSVASLYANTVTIMGPSKSDGLAGWRIGYLHAPAEIVEQMIKVQQVFYVCAPTPAQKALLLSLRHDYQTLVDKFEKKRDAVFSTLSKKYPISSLQGSFYAFFEVGNDKEYVEKLVGKSVLLVPGSVFSTKLTHVRLAYGVNDNLLQKGLDIIMSV